MTGRCLGPGSEPIPWSLGVKGQRGGHLETQKALVPEAQLRCVASEGRAGQWRPWWWWWEHAQVVVSSPCGA